eukprot:SAG25_NODE_3873_length_942_cov_1.370546_1_plen_74_part_10
MSSAAARRGSEARRGEARRGMLGKGGPIDPLAGWPGVDVLNSTWAGGARERLPLRPRHYAAGSTQPCCGCCGWR